MKKGFTLAEILITLTIVGVVAALTLPSLMTNVSQAKIGPALAKFVNTWENGVRQYMANEETSQLNTYKFTDGKEDYSSILDPLGQYIVWSKPNPDDMENYKYYSGSGELVKSYSANDVDSARILKDGALIILYRRHDWVDKEGTPLKMRICDVMVDINGFQKPNTLGKDLFVFQLDATGILVPFGSSMYKKAMNVVVECDPSSSNTSKNMACTGVIADNGWKANY